MKNKSMGLLIIFAFLFQISFPSAAGPIINGQEWFQPADVTGFSWNDFNAICPAGACAGQVGGTGPDLSGWTWATVFDVNTLFNSFIGTTELSGPSAYFEVNSTWAPTFFTSFTKTHPSNFVDFIFGLTADTTARGAAQRADLWNFPFLGHRAIARTNGTRGKDSPHQLIGAWLYRPTATATAAAAAVPSPTTLTLFVLGLAGLGISHRKRSLKS